MRAVGSVLQVPRCDSAPGQGRSSLHRACALAARQHPHFSRTRCAPRRTRARSPSSPSFLESRDGHSPFRPVPVPAADHRRRRPRHDGHRHRRGPRQGRPHGRRHRHQRGPGREVRRRPGGLHRPWRRARAADRAGPYGHPRPGPHLHRPRGGGRRRPGHRGGAGIVRGQAADLPGAGRDRAPRDDPGDRHQRPVRHPAGRRLLPSGAGAGPALLQPGPGDAAGRGRLLGADRAGGRHGGHRPRPGPGQGARRGRGPPRIRRRRPAVRLPQPGRRDVRGEVRLPRGHRRRDAAGLRAAHGPAGAAGPDRRRHRAHGPGGDVRRVPRPPARTGPDPQAAERGGPDRP